MRIKLWAAAGIALLVFAIVLRLGWEFIDEFPIGGFVTVCLSILSVLAIGGLLIFSVFKPRKLASPAFWTGAVGLGALGMIGGLLDCVRFVFLSGVPLLAIVIAVALGLASICGFVSMLYGLRWVKLKLEESAVVDSGSKDGSSRGRA